MNPANLKDARSFSYQKQDTAPMNWGYQWRKAGTGALGIRDET